MGTVKILANENSGWVYVLMESRKHWQTWKLADYKLDRRKKQGAKNLVAKMVENSHPPEILNIFQREVVPQSQL